MKLLAKADIDLVLFHLNKELIKLKNKKIFITGGTGFIGKNLLQFLIAANNILKLNCTIDVLTRDNKSFLKEYPFFANQKNLSFIKGDILKPIALKTHYNFIIHAATNSDSLLNSTKPMLMIDTVVEGTKNLLNFAVENKNLESFLFLSSGAVYGKQSHKIKLIKETDGFFLDLNNPTIAYAEAKRMAELLIGVYANQNKLPAKIARCFSFVGPYLPLDKHFAIGNFIQNVLQEKNIEMNSDGQALRSYMYTADLCVWLIKILLNGKINQPYNVGSDKEISIKELALLVSTFASKKIKVKTLKAKQNLYSSNKYIPNIELAKKELNLKIYTPLKKAIEKTIAFYK